MKDYTPHQQRIIKNYYRNKEGLALQKLQELVTELYLAETEKKKDQIWKRIEKCLGNIGASKELVSHIMTQRSPEILAENIKHWWERTPGER